MSENNEDKKFFEFPLDLDILFERAGLLGNASPKEWYIYLKKRGFDPKPLGYGNFKGIKFENGGGFVIHWGGDKILMYHPPKRTHHGENAYWKLSSGPFGKLRYDLTGNELEE
jgi:hypothetical protein